MPDNAAGIIFRHNRKLLLIKNTKRQEWEFPGGMAEGDEDARGNAMREAREEIGAFPDAEVRPYRTKSAHVEYTQFIADVPMFEATLSDEHDAWGWFEPGEYPQPIHEPCIETLALLEGNELDIAEAMVAGLLSSPQRYENIWLFDIRVTGTGTSWRSAHEEYCFRPSEVYMNDRFLKRIAGLATIFEHPENDTLDTAEFRERSIGSVFLPYMRQNVQEIWAIAKIYDDEAAICMQDTHLSTSPAVVFRDRNSVEKLEFANGDKILVEGDPDYIDHIAICVAGVWDKGGEPAGINNGDNLMADEPQKKADGADGLIGRMDAMMSRFDAFESRMDAFEAKKADAVKADAEDETEEEKKVREEKEAEEAKKKEEAAKADSDEKDEKKAKADAEKTPVFADSAGVNARFADIESRLQRDWTDDERNAIADAVHRADNTFSALGKKVPYAMAGETPIRFRQRLAGIIQNASSAWKGVPLNKLPEQAFVNAETQIYADAMKAAMNPIDVPTGQLRAHKTTNEYGQVSITYTGDPLAWGAAFMPPIVKRLQRPVDKGNN